MQSHVLVVWTTWGRISPTRIKNTSASNPLVRPVKGWNGSIDAAQSNGIKLLILLTCAHWS